MWGEALSGVDAIKLALFKSRIEAVSEEMGVTLRRAAFSPNIKDRLDYSCALFDESGELFGQAAHIPVHLGSMAFAMAGIVSRFEWQPEDVVIVNDPFLGGTHLPDVTVVAPVFSLETIEQELRLCGYVACRAHHANIGSDSPGSMPISRSIREEGVIIPPLLAIRGGQITQELHELLDQISGRSHKTAQMLYHDERLGDFFAQFSAVRLGASRLRELIGAMGISAFRSSVRALNDYGERLARYALGNIPDGIYCFSDLMDDDGVGTQDIGIRVTLTIEQDRVGVDFSGTHDQVAGNINCPLSVTAAAVYYVFRCLMPPQTPAVAGAFRPIVISAPLGSLLHAQSPAATAAGNVETSSRIVDVLLGALSRALPDQMPGASQGTMNNIAMGNHAANRQWDYYETIAGGQGGNSTGAGLDGTHSHMTNTLNTPIESLESHYPLRITRYEVRRGSGGVGLHPGGCGLIREFQFLAAAEVTLLTERRRHAPWGLGGAGSGKMGRNLLNGSPVPGKISFHANPGDRLTIETPGGGGWSQAGAGAV